MSKNSEEFFNTPKLSILYLNLRLPLPFVEKLAYFFLCKFEFSQGYLSDFISESSAYFKIS